MKKTLLTLSICLSILHPSEVLSWNGVAHRLIAQIAYDQITRQAKTTFNRYNRDAVQDDVSKNFVNSSAWLDSIRRRTHTYDAMHYIDLPFSTDGTPLPSVPTVNAVSAVEQAKNVLSNSEANSHEKGIALRILIHVVGDIHQPLHATTRVSRQNPDGDRGGNLVKLHKNPIAKNLHAYWDKGAGLFVGKRRYGQVWIKQKARAIEQHWPCAIATVDLNPMHWAQESKTIAMQRVYALPVDANYQRGAQQIAEQRIALAGCRLAGLMNEINSSLQK